MLKLKSCFLFLLLLIGTCAYGQYFKKIGMNDGLSNLSVMSICQDTLGRMWFGTNEGINIYDGAKIERIKYCEVSSEQGKIRKFINGNIDQILKDSYGKMFIRNNFSLFEYDVFNETIRELCASNVRTIAWMHGQLWAVIKDSLGIYNQERDCWTFNKRLRIPGVTCMQQLADRLYIGTMKGLYLWYQEQLVCVLPDVKIFRLFASSKGELWIASRMDGLFRINSDGKLYREEISSSRVVSGQIREFVEDSQQNIWFGTFDGLQVYNPFEDSYKVYRPGIYPGQIEHESVFSLYCDNQGTIWVGTYYGGVNYFNLESDLFTYYHPHHIQDGKCLNFPIVGQIVEDDERNLWIATDGGGVNKFDRKKRTFSYYEATGGNSLLHDNIKTVAYASDLEYIYVGTYTGGLSRYDKRTGRFYNYLFQYKSKGIGPDGSIYYCLYREGYLYVAAHNGFWQLDVNTDQFTLISNHYNIQVFEIDKNGCIWWASGKNLFSWNPKNEKIDRRFYVQEDISNARITQILSARDGTIYFSTLGAGVFSYDSTTDSIRHYTSAKDGLLSDYCYNLAETPMNNILITNDRGISIYSPFNGTVRSVELRSEKGMISAVSEGGGICVASDDRIYIGGVDGMISFSERELYEVYNADANFYFSSLQVNNKLVRPHDSHHILDVALPFTRKLDLAYNQNNLALTFANSNYIALDRTTAYQYMLGGFDDDWISTDQYSLSYTNLSPGNYVLKVRETGNKLSDAYNKEIALEICIHRPWFATFWAYLCYLLIVSGILYGFWRIRRARHLLAVSLENEKIEKERIEEVNKMKLRFFTNISHEFRTPLTLIIGQIELLMQSDKFSAAVLRKLESVHRNAVHLRFLITELLDFRKQEQGFLKLKVECRDVVALAREVYASFEELAGNRRISYSFESVDEELLLWFDPVQMQKVFYNLLSNAFKYTEDGGTIKMYIRRLRQSVEIGVADTGCGIPQESLSLIFERFYQVDGGQRSGMQGSGIGLAFTKSIVEAHKGEIDVDSTVGKGSCFKIHLLMGNGHFSAEELEHAPAVLSGMDWQKPSVPFDKVEATEPVNDVLADEDASSRPVVLLVEDDEEVLDMLVGIFSPAYQVHQATDGQKGLEMAGELHPDLIVSDVMMPVMSGKEMCYKIKNNLELAYIPVVLLTAQASEDHTIEGYMFGADDYIVKPFNVKLLLTRCRNLLNSRKMLLKRESSAVNVAVQDAPGLSSADQALLDQVTEAIRRHFDNPVFDMSLLASELNMGRSKMFARIKEITGLTPNEYTLKIKLTEALRMLQEEPQFNISEISYSLGFTSPRYFSRCFKAFYGVSPQSYRKKNEE